MRAGRPRTLRHAAGAFNVAAAVVAARPTTAVDVAGESPRGAIGPRYKFTGQVSHAVGANIPLLSDKGAAKLTPPVESDRSLALYWLRRGQRSQEQSSRSADSISGAVAEGSVSELYRRRVVSKFARLRALALCAATRLLYPTCRGS